MRPAWGAEVVSSNIVGYEKVSLSPGYNMVGIQFTQVGGDTLDLSKAAILDDSMAGFDDEETFASTLQVWTGDGYRFYGWSGTSGSDVYEDSSYDNLWLRATTMEPDETVAPAGFGFWIKAEKAGTVTIAGEVPSAATTEVNLVSGYNMVANPYPGEVSIASFGQLDESFAGFDDEENFATTLQVWTGDGYRFYGWSGTSGTDVYEDSSYDNLWLRSTTMEPDSLKIPFGTAVWIKAANAGKITFTSPSASSGN